MRKLVLLGVTAASAALVAAPGVGAAHGTLKASPSTVKRGGTITFTGGPCIAGDTVILLSKLFPGHAYGVGDITAKAGANGRFSKAFVVPNARSDGSYSVTARCGGGNLGVVAHVRVQGGPTTTLKASPALVHRGGSVTFTGGTCVGGDTVYLISKLFPGHAFGGAGAIRATAFSDGHFKRTFVVPRSTSRGVYSVTARCGGGNLGVAARVRVG